MQAYFITGTDTEVGKTYCSCVLLSALAANGKATLGYKPVAAGCDWRNNRWENEDALAIMQASSVDASLRHINPITLAPPIAPHIAAQEVGITLEPQQIIEGYQRLLEYQPDLLLMEGAGGWRLPLGEGRFLSDVVKTLKLEVILVVGMRLGCLNHALLTAEAILADGLKIKGWIANQVDADMLYYPQNLATLKEYMPAPMLAEIKHGAAKDPAVQRTLAEVFG